MSHWFDISRRKFLGAASFLLASLAFSRTRADQPYSATGFDPQALYLTWVDDPCTSMTVHWHTLADDSRAKGLYYRTAGDVAYRGPAPEPDNTWVHTLGKTRPLPGSDRTVHYTTLVNLKPGTIYDFFFETNGPVFRFKTLPATLDRPVRFIVSGDIYKSLPRLEQAFIQGAKTNPDFAVLAGDIAYDNGKLSMVYKCLEFLALWKRNMVGADGCLVPMLPLMGNHEVEGGFHQPPAKAQAFNALYELPGGLSYRSVCAGDYLALFLMDTDHTHPVEGVQTDWLKAELQKRSRSTHKIPIYHVPAYPSSRSNIGTNKAVKGQWVPLFEANGVGVAFEHHDHTYKRTYPIRNDQIADDGIVYFGDGGWALAAPRVPKKAAEDGNWFQSRWYLSRTGSLNHFHLCELHPDRREVRSYTVAGKCFDITSQDAKTLKSQVTYSSPFIQDRGADHDG